MLMQEGKKDLKRIRGGAKYTVATTERGIKIDEMQTRTVREDSQR